MVISFGNNGQFGNAYLASAYLAANALENGYPIHILNLAEYVHSLAVTNPVPSIRLSSSVILQRIGVKLGWMLARMGASNDLGINRVRFVRDNGRDPLLFTKFGKKGVVFHFGWKFRDREALIKHAGTIRNLLQFREDIVNSSKLRFEAIRKDAKHVIGVHVRQGDYRTHRGGMFYFEEEVYLRLAGEAVVASGYEPGKVVVIGFSNEKLVWPETMAKARVECPVGTMWEDIICLSMCDLIIGPPSTFTGSASLYGDVPFFRIMNEDAPFDPMMAHTYLQSGIQI